MLVGRIISIIRYLQNDLAIFWYYSIYIKKWYNYNIYTDENIKPERERETFCKNNVRSYYLTTTIEKQFY